MRPKFSFAAGLTALIGFALCLGAALPAAAQPSAQFAACQKAAKTQLAINACAGNELLLRNKQMSQIYNQLLAHAKKQPWGTAAKIQAAQKAWLAYADAYMNAEWPAPNKQAEYGSIYPMASALARAALVERHIQDLSALLHTDH